MSVPCLAGMLYCLLQGLSAYADFYVGIVMLGVLLSCITDGPSLRQFFYLTYPLTLGVNSLGLVVALFCPG